MQWRDEGILLNLKAYGEKALLVSLFGREQGLVRGFVYKNKTTARLQISMHVKAIWKARLESHMGHFELETLPSPYVFLSFDQPQALHQLQTMCQLLLKVLAERHPYPSLFQAFLTFLNALPTPKGSFQQVLFQWKVLQTLGYGLDLSRCAATGETENLTHVSPKSGRAVSYNAALPYQDKLLPLPSFVLDYANHQTASLVTPSPQEVSQGLKLTQFFIEKYLLAS